MVDVLDVLLTGIKIDPGQVGDVEPGAGAELGEQRADQLVQVNIRVVGEGEETIELAVPGRCQQSRRAELVIPRSRSAHQRKDGGGGERAGEQETLDGGAAGVPQVAELGWCLDALGDETEPEPLGHGQGGFDDGDVGVRVLDLVDEAAVDLEPAHRG